MIDSAMHPADRVKGAGPLAGLAFELIPQGGAGGWPADQRGHSRSPRDNVVVVMDRTAQHEPTAIRTVCANLIDSGCDL